MDLVSTQIRPVLGMAKWKTGTKGIREPSSSSSSNRHTEAWRYKCSGYPGGDRTQSLPFGLPQHTGSHPQAQHKGQGFPFSLWVIPQTLHHKGKCLWKQGISKLLLSDSASMPSQMKVASKSNQEIACTWCISLSLPGRRCLSQALLGVGDAQSALKYPPSHGDKELTPQLFSPPPQLSDRRWRDGLWKSLAMNRNIHLKQ